MSEKKQTGNPIFDLWLDNQEQFLKAQSQWMKPELSSNSKAVGEEFLDRSLESWQRCEEQYQTWMKTAENWLGSKTKTQVEQDDYSAQALSYMLNPATFMQSGLEMMDQVFRKLVNGPEFADIGMLEKKIMKTGQDWQTFRDAGNHYQEVIASAWLRAYQHFSDEFVDNFGDKNFKAEESLNRWLKIADEELIATLRSEEFLEAQRNLFSAGTAYKLKYREFAEMWCESHTIPTRSEVDDLHKIIYQLRREVRGLKKQVQTLAKAPEKPAGQAVTRKAAANKPKTWKSPVKKRLVKSKVSTKATSLAKKTSAK